MFLQGKPLFIETVIVDDRDTLQQLAGWLRARGKERREVIWFRDADVAYAVLFVGLSGWYPPNYDCGACGYATCVEFLHATKPLREASAELEFDGPPATCETSTSASPSAPPPRPPPSTPSTVAARPASPSPPASSTSSTPTSPSPSPYHSPTKPSASTAASTTSTSTPSTCPAPAPSQPASRVLSAATAPATANNPAHRSDPATGVHRDQLGNHSRRRRHDRGLHDRRALPDRSCTAPSRADGRCRRFCDRAHRVERKLRATHANQFSTDAPIALMPASWQDTGSGVVTFAAGAAVLGVGPQRREAAQRVVAVAAIAGLVAYLVDVYLHRVTAQPRGRSRSTVAVPARTDDAFSELGSGPHTSSRVRNRASHNARETLSRMPDKRGLATHASASTQPLASTWWPHRTRFGLVARRVVTR